MDTLLNLSGTITGTRNTVWRFHLLSERVSWGRVRFRARDFNQNHLEGFSSKSFVLDFSA
eukprot:1985228-Amphidinium_carterae.1